MQKSRKTINQIDVLVSSTRLDLEQYCAEAVKVIDNIGDTPDDRRYFLRSLAMEREPQSGTNESPVQVSRRWVEESEWMVLIVGWNYGTVPQDPEAEGLSITELEYRHAVAQLNPRRRLFVFMAGEPDSTQRYRWIEAEKNDLKDWALKQTAEANAKINTFRAALKTQHHTTQFANIDVFRQSLEKALRSALTAMPPPISAGSTLARLIIAVAQPIKACFRGVNMIANCKEIHDRLHELRHKVIRPLRDEVLSVWQQDDSLSRHGQWRLANYLAKMSAQVAAIRVARKSIGAQHWFLGSTVDRVLGSPDWPNPLGPECDSVPDLKQFTGMLDDFAANVQIAFSQADRSMHEEENRLGESYLRLRDELQKGRHEIELGEAEQRRLDEELKTLEANRLYMKTTLVAHHSWQEVHDLLEDLNELRDVPKFKDRLNRFRTNTLQLLIALANSQFGPSGAADRDASNGVAVAEPPTASVVKDALDEQLRSLIEKIQNFEAHPGIDEFDDLRKPFDEAFYLIDRRTKAKVEHARERVEATEQWFDAISAVGGALPQS